MFDRFEFAFPLFFLARKATKLDALSDSSDLHDIVTLSNPGDPTGVALFTDEHAAEQFRDEQAPEHLVFGIPDNNGLLAFLLAIRKSALAEVVALDPYRLGLKTRIARIDDFLQKHGVSPS